MRKSQQRRGNLHLVWNERYQKHQLNSVCGHPIEKEKHFYFLQSTYKDSDETYIRRQPSAFILSIPTILKTDSSLFPLEKWNKRKLWNH